MPVLTIAVVDYKTRVWMFLSMQDVFQIVWNK
ncbi:hypothetical protein ROLI_042350 [Roseobacter fucihabitans]|uniref:Uncharacterized protein n=1 Tax=Roseobacter fucihabitans TaxID=1537242 RepID=A0ABZ2BYI2_9RHOB|nr:hypothetical protein [Roseobacter litoralis]